VELGAVVVVPANEEFAAIDAAQPARAGFESARPLYSSRMPILGNDVLQSWMDRVRSLGVHSLWLTSGQRDGALTGASLADFAQQGIERLLMIRLKSYAEMDLADLLRFHCERRNPVTEAQDARGRLGVCLLDQAALRAGNSSTASNDSRQTPYQFGGYAKRISSARERQELVRDALNKACALRPVGTQIRDRVWIGKGANLADSARIIGPAYIGARTTVRAGATIGPFASVEHDCLVDCGTTIERSTVLPHTYLAPGLLIRNGLMDGEHLEDLKSGAVANLHLARLGRKMPARECGEQECNDTTAHISFHRDNDLAWGFAPSSAPSTPWLQVQL
jgi:hypothetical protein